MSGQFALERLFELSRLTHEETRHSADCAIDRSLVVPTRLCEWCVVELGGGASARREL